MKRKMFTLFVLVWLPLLIGLLISPAVARPANAPETGLVVHLNCDEGTGLTAYDTSGNSNDALGASYALWHHTFATDDGYAQCLWFYGDTGRTWDCGHASSLNIKTTGITLEAWVKPASTQNFTDAGILGKGFATYMLTDTSGKITLYLNWNSGIQLTGPTLATGKYSHVVATYDNSHATLYVNGLQVAQTTYTTAIADSASTDLYVGSVGTGNSFNGDVDEVRVYNRPISYREVVSNYNLGLSGSTTAGPTAAKRLNSLVTQLFHNDTGNITTTKTFNYTVPNNGWVFLSSAATISSGSLTLKDTAYSANPIITQSATGTKEAMVYLLKGTHQMTVTVVSGSPVLNNLYLRAVPELVYGNYQNAGGPDYSPNLYLLSSDGSPGSTAYTNKVWNYDNWAGYFSVAGNNILANINTMITDSWTFGYDPTHGAHLSGFESTGGKVIQDVGVIYDSSAGQSYNDWITEPGYTNSLGNGIIGDEYGPDPSSYSTTYGYWKGDIDSLYTNYPGWAGKVCNAFIGMGQKAYWSYTNSKAWMQNVMNHGSTVWEFYIMDQRDATGSSSASRTQADNAWANGTTGVNGIKTGNYDFDAFESTFAPSPTVGGEWPHRHFTANLGNCSSAPNMYIYYPQVDYKVHLDRAMYLLATNPAFQDMYGLAWYYSQYADEETQRWSYKLFRHYAIEGSTAPLSDTYGYNYLPNILVNPDFDNYPNTPGASLNGWGYYNGGGGGSISTGHRLDYGWMEGRGWNYSDAQRADGSYKVGDYYATMTRGTSNVVGPEVIFQTITGLTIGQKYIVRMIASDPNDIYNTSKNLGVSLWALASGGTAPTIDTAHSFHAGYTSSQSPLGSGFTGQIFANYYQLVFTANSTSVEIDVRDWPNSSPLGPGYSYPTYTGAAGQTIAVNYIKCTPFFDVGQ